MALRPVWAEVNRHYAHLGVNVKSLPELVEQLGILRYGHRPRVGDTFSRRRLHPLRGRAHRLRRLCLRPQPHRLHVDLGRLNIIGASPSDAQK
jgi:putative DNA methylase